MNLRNLLFPGKNEGVALIGGGGKTSIMAQAARESASRGFSLLLSTTTKLQRPCPLPHVRLHSHPHPPEMGRGPVLWVGEAVAGGEKWTGPGLELLESFLLTSGAQTAGPAVLIEADGSAGRPVKAPNEHEPVIPAGIGTVAMVMGLSALGRPVSDLTVHRLNQFLQITGSTTDDILSPELLLRLIVHPLGSFRGVPGGVRRLVFLNQADTDDDVRRGEHLAREILDNVPGVECVAVTSFSPAHLLAGGNPIRSMITG